MQKLVSLRSDYGDGNDYVIKSNRLKTQTTTQHVQQTFMYISLPSLPDYNVKMPNFTYYGGRTQATTKFSSFLMMNIVLRSQLQESSLTVDLVSTLE